MKVRSDVRFYESIKLVRPVDLHVCDVLLREADGEVFVRIGRLLLGRPHVGDERKLSR